MDKMKIDQPLTNGLVFDIVLILGEKERGKRKMKDGREEFHPFRVALFVTTVLSTIVLVAGAIGYTRWKKGFDVRNYNQAVASYRQKGNTGEVLNATDAALGAFRLKTVDETRLGQMLRGLVKLVNEKKAPNRCEWIKVIADKTRRGQGVSIQIWEPVITAALECWVEKGDWLEADDLLHQFGLKHQYHDAWVETLWRRWADEEKPFSSMRHPLSGALAQKFYNEAVSEGNWRKARRVAELTARVWDLALQTAVAFEEVNPFRIATTEVEVSGKTTKITKIEVAKARFDELMAADQPLAAYQLAKLHDLGPDLERQAAIKARDQAIEKGEYTLAFGPNGQIWEMLK